jgi:TRAP-type C4-dicarboxylate transport system substrate-binding protein
MKIGVVRTTIVALGFVSCMQLQAQAAPVEFDVATAYAVDSFHTLNLQTFADEVGKSTSGEVVLRVHPNGSLVKPTEIVTAVRNGRVAAGEVIMSSLADECALCGIDALPFIVASYDDARRLWEITRAAVDETLQSRGLQLLYAVPWPPQNLYAKNAIASVRDFQGLRMRSYNPATYRIAELIGTHPVTIQTVDLAKAMARDEFDLMLTSSWTGVETKAWSRLRYYYKVQAWLPKNIVFINKEAFAKLGASSQTALLDAARIAEQRGWKMSEDSDRQFEQQLAPNLTLVSTIDPAIRQYLDRIGESLAQEWLRQAEGDAFKLLLKYTTERSTD